jgi:hypothetical protein
MQMARLYKSNNLYSQWFEAEMQEAKNSVLQGNLPLLSADALFPVPYLRCRGK